MTETRPQSTAGSELPADGVARDQADGAEAMALLGQFAATFGHDLSQPLTAMLNYADFARLLLDDDPLDRTELTEVLNTLLEQATQASAMVRSLGLISSGASRRADVFPLGPMLAELADMVSPQAQRAGVSLELACAPELRVSGDKGQLLFALADLVRHAIKDLRAAERSDKRLRINAQTAGKNIVVRVSDAPGQDRTGVPEPKSTAPEHAGHKTSNGASAYIIEFNNGSLRVNAPAPATTAFDVTLRGVGDE